MRYWLALPSLWTLSVIAVGQMPDVTIRVDAGPHYRSQHNGETTLRWYDSLGKHSIVGLQFMLEPGFRVYVAERLQRIPHDGDSEQLDEYYIEDTGSWRLGKQYLPFGRGMILKESVRAARGDTNLLVEGLTFSAAACDAGANREQGIIGRVGGTVGVSLAVGRHFGIQGTSLNAIRRPEDAPGAGRGYRLAVGLDGYRTLGKFSVEGEAVVFRKGHTPLDPDFEVTDLAFNLANTKKLKVALAWSRNWRTPDNFFRATAQIALAEKMWVEPIFRFNRAGWYDVGVSLRAKL